MDNVESAEKALNSELQHRILYRYAVSILVLSLGTALSVYLFFTFRVWEEKKIRTIFERAAGDHISALNRSIEKNIDVLRALSSFYASSYEVERSEFKEFTFHLLKDNSSIQALEWIPRLPDKLRMAYEKRAQEEGFPDFRITERNSKGVMVKADRRDEYFPVYFVEPYEGNEVALGFDLASNSTRLEALHLSRDTGRMTATARIKLVQERGAQFGFLIFQPVYLKNVPIGSIENRRMNLEGFVLGVFGIGDLLEDSLAYLESRGIDIYLYDKSAPVSDRFLSYYSSRTRTEPVAPPKESKIGTGFHYSRTLDVAGRKWLVLSTPTPDFISAVRTFRPWMVFTGGVLFSVLFSGYIFIILSRSSQMRQYAIEILKSKEALEQEIAGRRKAEEALRESEVKYRDLVETSQDLIWQSDPEGRLTFLNKAWEKTHGYSIEEMLDRRFTDFERPEIAARDTDRFRRLLEGGSITGYETTHISKSGEGIHLIFNAIPRYAPEGNIVGAQGTAYDITEHKRMEEEVLRAQKLESLGILAGGLAHDFNNFLTGILGNITMARMYLDSPDKAKERLEQAEEASIRASDLTQQLLTFSKGGAPIKKTTSIGELIKESSGFALRGSNVKCLYNIPDNLWPLEVDEGQMNQVINNLIINADQSMPEGGIINVSCENVFIRAEDAVALNEGVYVKISIRDEGTGIPEDHLQRIFDPYFSTKQKGSGLGLASVYSIVKRHNGLITVESGIGSGTTFHIYLSASHKEIIRERAAEKVPLAGKGRILLMDDEEIVREVAGEMLRSLGHEVEFTRDGEETIALYQESQRSDYPFDAVVLDLTIPGGMGGKEVIRRLHEIDPGVKAIVSNGYSSDPIMSRYKKYGFKGVVSKPYSIQELNKTLHEVLEAGC